MLVALALAGLHVYSNTYDTRDDPVKVQPPDRDPYTNPRAFNWPQFQRFGYGGVEDDRTRANAYGQSFTTQSAIHGAQDHGDFSTPAYIPEEAFTPADRASRERTLNMAYQWDIPFSGYNDSNQPWDIRYARNLPNSDPFVADWHMPSHTLWSNGLGPWPRDTPIGPVHPEKVLYDVDFLSTTDFNYSHGISDPIFRPEIVPELQEKRFVNGIFI